MLKECNKERKVYLLGGKEQWTQKTFHNATNETFFRVYAKHKQRELNEKGKKTRNVLGKHVIGLYSSDFSQVIKRRDIRKLQ